MKLCTSCGESKPLDKFPVKTRNRDGRDRQCKSCHAVYQKAHYVRTKDKYRAGRAESRKKQYCAFVAIISKYKLERGCSICGWNKHPAGLDFHHVDTDKEFAIAKMAGLKLERIMAEVSKCIVLCACCHRIEHCST